MAIVLAIAVVASRFAPAPTSLPSPKDVVCSHCKYRGLPGYRDRFAVLKVTILVVMFFASFFLWPLFLLTLLLLFVFLFGSEKVCKKCGAFNPIPVDQWEKLHANASAPD